MRGEAGQHDIPLWTLKGVDGAAVCDGLNSEVKWKGLAVSMPKLCAHTECH